MTSPAGRWCAGCRILFQNRLHFQRCRTRRARHRENHPPVGDSTRPLARHGSSSRLLHAHQDRRGSRRRAHLRNGRRQSRRLRYGATSSDATRPAREWSCRSPVARKRPVHDSPVVLLASVVSRASGWPVARLLFGQRLSGRPRSGYPENRSPTWTRSARASLTRWSVEQFRTPRSIPLM